MLSPPSAHYELAVNVVLHAIILFGALLALFIFMVAPLSRTAMERELTENIHTHFHQVLVDANALSEQAPSQIVVTPDQVNQIPGVTVPVVGVTVPDVTLPRDELPNPSVTVDVPKKTLKELLAENRDALTKVRDYFVEEDEETILWNQTLLNYGYWFLGLCGVILITMLAVARWVGNQAVGRMLLVLLATNLVVFGCVGAIEFVFFTRVATQYVPVMPSAAINRMLRELQQF